MSKKQNLEMNTIIFMGENLLKFRKEKGLSQEELAEKVNVSRQSIHLWESGKIIPDIENVVKLCKILDISINDIASGLDVMNNISISKSYNKKKNFKVVIIIFIILLIVYTIISLRKSFILMKINNKMDNYLCLNNYYYEEKNYYMKSVEENQGYNKIEVYYKDGKMKKKYYDSNQNESLIYEDYNIKKHYFIDNKDNTYEEKIINYMNIYGELYIPVGTSKIVTLGNEYQIVNLIYGFNPFLKIKENDNEYIIKWTINYDKLGYKEKIEEKINKETGLIKEKYIFKDDGSYTVTQYEIKINVVKDSEINMIDISSYKQKDG